MVNNIFLYIIQNCDLNISELMCVVFEIVVTYVVAYIIYNVKMLIIGKDWGRGEK